MSSTKGYYSILGISKGATEAEIKKAYRQLSKKYHPDKNPGDKEAEEKFKEVNEANEILSNQEKRAKYDSGEMNFGFEFEPGFDDIRSQFHSMFTKPSHRGDNIGITIPLTLEEVKKGVHKKVVYHKGVICSSCSGNGSKFGKSITTCSLCLGSGRLQRQFGPMTHVTTCHHCMGHGKFTTAVCDDCGGSGMSKQEMNIEIDIPKGAFPGWKSRLENLGSDSIHVNSGPGDLIITTDDIPHPIFERHGDDLIYRLELSLPDMILGTKVEIPTLEDTNITFDVPENTPVGKIFKVKGRGLPNLRTAHVGDILAVAIVQVPTQVTAEEKNILEDLRKNSNFVSKNTYKR